MLRTSHFNKIIKTITVIFLLAGGIMFPAPKPSPVDLQTMLKTAERYLDWQYFAEARDAYLEILRQYPDSGRVHETLGYIYMAQQEYGEAISHFEKELAQAPGNELARLLLGIAHFQAGHAGTAWKLIAQVNANRSALKKSHFPRKFMNDNPGLLPFIRGILYLEQNEWQNAEAMMAEAIEQKYCLAEILVQLIDLYLRQQNAASATVALVRLARENSQMAEQLDAFVKAQDSQQAHDYANSRPLIIRYFRQPVALIVDELNKMARSAVERADPSSAFKTWEKALSADDNRFDIHYNLALIYCLYNFKQEALFHCRRAIDLGDSQFQAWALNLAGNIHFEMRNFEQARKYYQQAIHLDPKYLKCRNNLGATYWKLNDLAKAEAEWLLVIRNSGKGEKEQAIRELNQDEKIKVIVDVKESDEIIEASKSLARLYVEQKRAAEAIPLLEKVLQFIPSDSAAHFELGKIFMQMNQPALALSHLKAALKHGTENEFEAVNLCAKLEKILTHSH